MDNVIIPVLSEALPVFIIFALLVAIVPAYEALVRWIIRKSK